MNPGDHILALAADETPRNEAVPMTRGAKAPRTLLPSPPPDAGASREHVTAWLTVALALGADPVDSVERYGLSEDARMVVILKSKRRVTFERAADAFDARRLERIIVLATGAKLPHYAAKDTADIAGAMVRAAHTLAEDDCRDEAREWARTFMHVAQDNAIEVHGLGTPAGRYEALSVLAEWNAPQDDYGRTPPARRAPIVVDAVDGTRWVRTSDVGAHVRSEGARIGWGALHSRMVEIGWTHRGEVEQRQPKGNRKRKVHVYEIAAGWDQ
jgi:hypothetical protein